MRVLVTGAAGFIGSHLVDALHLRGHHVSGVDLNPTPLVHRSDLLEPGAFAACVEHEQPDLVVHLAAQVGRLFGEDDIRNSVRSNTEMTAVVASECGHRDIRLAYASTSEVYGDRGDRVCHESDTLDVLPHNAYGVTKRQGEEFCTLYTEDPILFRFSMPYGPGVPPGRGRRALDTMLWQAHHRMPITVHRGAERSWCWIGDTVNGIIAVLERGEGGAWNVGRDDRPLSMLALAEMCCEIAGAPRSLITEIDPPPRQTVVKRLATGKLRGIGWEPRTELPDALPVMYDWITNFDREARWLPVSATA